MAEKKQRPIPLLGYAKSHDAGPGSARPPTAEITEAYRHAGEVFTVASRGVERAAYDALTETMFVTWITGATYAYTGVPPEKWEAWKSADSKGRFANFAIKYRHSCYGPL